MDTDQMIKNQETIILLLSELINVTKEAAVISRYGGENALARNVVGRPITTDKIFNQLVERTKLSYIKM